MMIPLHEDPHFTFRFADDRIIPRFHLEGVEAGREVSVFKIGPDTGERLGLLATATVGEGGWVDLGEPIIVKAGDVFIAVPEPGRSKLVNAILRRKWHDLLGAWTVMPSVTKWSARPFSTFSAYRPRNNGLPWLPLRRGRQVDAPLATL